MLAPFKEIGGHVAYVSNTTITTITIITVTIITIPQLRAATHTRATIDDRPADINAASFSYARIVRVYSRATLL